MAIFIPKSRVNPFGKMSIFRPFCFYSLEKRFCLLEYHKRHFPGLHCLKIKSWKNDHFWTKTTVNTVRKMSIFRLFELVVLIAQKSVFFVLEYHKRHFPGLYCPPPAKKVGKMAIIRPKPWKNVNFGVFSILCFYSLERRFFFVEYHKIHFAGLYCLKKKVEKWPFLDLNHG